MKIQIIYVRTGDPLVTIAAKNRGTSVTFTEGALSIAQKPNAPLDPEIPEITVQFDISIHSVNIGS